MLDAALNNNNIYDNNELNILIVLLYIVLYDFRVIFWFLAVDLSGFALQVVCGRA